MRFKACDENLEVKQGVLHLQKAVSTVDLPGAVGIRQATRALKEFFTPAAPPSYGGLVTNDPKPHFHEDLILKVIDKIEVLAADGAADEELALREMAGMAGPNMVQLKDTMTQVFPKLKAWRVN